MTAPPVIRVAGAADGPALAALRRAWTVEQHGPVDDDGFEGRFLDWYDREFARRVSWLAETGGGAVGMMNLVVFERMPRPGRDTGTWGYLANAFVLAAYRDQGTGSLLLRALVAYADSRDYVRVVLRPSGRAIPFYERLGFRPDGGFLVRHRKAWLSHPHPHPAVGLCIAGGHDHRLCIVGDQIMSRLPDIFRRQVCKEGKLASPAMQGRQFPGAGVGACFDNSK